MAVSEKAASVFFRNGWYTLTLQTRIVAALDAVKKPGCASYLESAADADNEREALFFVESAEMLQRHHAKAPVDKLLTDSRAIVAAAGSSAVSWRRWTSFDRRLRSGLRSAKLRGARARSSERPR